MSWDERADRFERKPISTSLRWTFIGVGLVVIAFIVITVLGFAGGWGVKAVSVVSPENVSKQYSVVIKTWEALETTASNACQAAGPADTSSNAPTLVESPSFAYSATYRNVRAKYNAAQENVFEAKLVGPAGYPKSVPDFAEAQGKNPDFCAVSERLSALRTSY